MRECIKCKKQKDISSFGKSKSWKDGICARCKECEIERVRKNYYGNILKFRQVALNCYYSHREKYMNKERNYREKNKEKVFLNYGGYKCCCCGEKEKMFLTIDHIEGGGTKQRKSLKGGGMWVYRWLIKNNFPLGFQVLCMNCNFGKGQNARKNGINKCPHENKN